MPDDAKLVDVFAARTSCEPAVGLVSQPSSQGPSEDRGLVIFDCDGVLVDSERLVVDIDVLAVRDLGWQITREEVIELFMGRSEADMRRSIEEHIGRELALDWDAAWQQEYRRVLDEELEAVPGVAAAVRAVESSGRATCVASSGSHAKMERTLARTGLWALFAGRIFSASEVEHGKPAPDLFLHAAQAMRTGSRRCVVVEDSRYGVAAAKAAGMAVIGYVGGITPRHHLSDADRLITDMAELPAEVDSLLG